MNVLAFTVDNAGYHRLKDMNVIHNCFVGQFSLFHGHHQLVVESVCPELTVETALRAGRTPFHSRSCGRPDFFDDHWMFHVVSNLHAGN